MAKFYEQLDDTLSAWIIEQRIFFVATAPLTADGHVNLSPKGGDVLRVLDHHTVAYLDLTGSGNETSAHIMENNRITMMWCSFDGPPNILRCYGNGEIALPGSPRWDALKSLFPDIPGMRQIIINHIKKVQTSCGYAVPYYDYNGERDALRKWSEHKGEEGLKVHHREQNTYSIDGLLTPMGASEV